MNKCTCGTLYELTVTQVDRDIYKRRCDTLQTELAASKRETFETTVQLKEAWDRIRVNERHAHAIEDLADAVRSIADLERQLGNARERIDVLLDYGLADIDHPPADLHDEETTG